MLEGQGGACLKIRGAEMQPAAHASFYLAGARWGHHLLSLPPKRAGYPSPRVPRTFDRYPRSVYKIRTSSANANTPSEGTSHFPYLVARLVDESVGVYFPLSPLELLTTTRLRECLRRLNSCD